MSNIRNVVLVHGGFVDGSGWKGVYDLLRDQGYNVSVVQNPTLSLEDDVAATKRILDRAGLSIDDIDTFEVNEAFAPVVLAWQKELHADPEKVNPRGGAIALGHALGSSGTRLLGTMVNTLEQTGGRIGLQVMCEGGGMSNATLIERL